MTNDNFNTTDEDFIERCPHDGENPYVQVSRDLVRDENISPECCWLIIYLLTNTTKFKISTNQVINFLKKNNRAGREKVYRMFDEAIEAGYMIREEVFVNNLKRIRYRISERPKFKKCFRHTGFQDAEIRDPENQHYKKEQEKKDQYKEKTTTTQTLQNTELEKPKSDFVVGFSEKQQMQEMLRLEDRLADKDKASVLNACVSNNVTPHRLNLAIDFSRKVIPRKSLAQQIVWHASQLEPPEIPPTPQEESTDNEKFTKKITSHIKHENSFCRLEIFNNRVEMIYLGAQKDPTVIEYKSREFKKKLIDLLSRCKLLTCGCLECKNLIMNE